MTDYIDHYDTHGPHRALPQQPPSPGRADQTAQLSPPDNVIRLPRCNGLINQGNNAA